MIKPLTSLRMFFALCVFLSHLSFLNNSNYEQLFNKIFHDGFLGVSFFFILSGFILAYNYQEKFFNKAISKRKFYIARFARVYPMHLFTMFIALILSFLSSNSNFGEYLIQHISLIQSFFIDKEVYFSLNAPSWSISNEVFFYLLFPLIVFLNNRLKFILIFFGIILILYLNYSLKNELQHYWLYISPIVRFFDFLLGILLFNVFIFLSKNFYKIEGFKSYLEFLAILVFVLFVLFHDSIQISYRYSIYYWIPMILVILIFSLSSINGSSGVFGKLLSNKYLVWAGEVSFCFYLIHLFVITIGYYIVSKFNLNIDLLFMSLVMFVFTLILSGFAYKYVEKPLNRKIKEKLI